ncbi:hypothetical protein, unlikely [Trypanosoma brucei gambiense DAL972]|uniref:T. brucei spp.-specific protein n=1 Tax=Trypanosoma brucei gambiense (strain MHOM/CI/86/DAL972) TaxID=679716 RepID=D0A9R4_TRYB9|nr:hypothetical protein, unlikely [Trypanosoma brucei gambiense DAL972]CBH18415.1 hypothetical protein, unlikely [Trypanosoma brucei gambiense DAL972]|eukprot:XP_011780679.1 hypothetical protein, unlikely [Trypanosoma brucei gambiense DAL972]
MSFCGLLIHCAGVVSLECGLPPPQKRGGIPTRFFRLQELFSSKSASRCARSLICVISTELCDLRGGFGHRSQCGHTLFSRGGARSLPPPLSVVTDNRPPAPLERTWTRGDAQLCS